jgi:hypothetical protein
MNTSLANQGGKIGVGARTRMPAMKVRTATAGSQPMVTKSASFRATTAKERRQNIAGAPYYRGLHWDF